MIKIPIIARWNSRVLCYAGECDISIRDLSLLLCVYFCCNFASYAYSHLQFWFVFADQLLRFHPRKWNPRLTRSSSGHLRMSRNLLLPLKTTSYQTALLATSLRKRRWDQEQVSFKSLEARKRMLYPDGNQLKFWRLKLLTKRTWDYSVGRKTSTRLKGRLVPWLPINSNRNQPKKTFPQIEELHAVP